MTKEITNDKNYIDCWKCGERIEQIRLIDHLVEKHEAQVNTTSIKGGET